MLINKFKFIKFKIRKFFQLMFIKMCLYYSLYGLIYYVELFKIMELFYVDKLF